MSSLIQNIIEIVRILVQLNMTLRLRLQYVFLLMIVQSDAKLGDALATVAMGTQIWA